MHEWMDIAQTSGKEERKKEERAREKRVILHRPTAKHAGHAPVLF